MIDNLIRSAGQKAAAGQQQSGGSLLPREQTGRDNAAHSLTLLVLDDDLVLAELLGEMLSVFGYQTVICHQPLEALAKVRQRDFDLIISDYSMPVMNGGQFYARVVEMKPALAFRFLFVTGITDNMAAFLTMTGVELTWLIKPITLRALESAVQRVLRQAGVRNDKQTPPPCQDTELPEPSSTF